MVTTGSHSELETGAARASHSVRTTSNSAPLRATAQTLAPRSAYLWASVRPMPEEAPKIKTRSAPGGTAAGRRSGRLAKLLRIAQSGTKTPRVMAAVAPMG